MAICDLVGKLIDDEIADIFVTDYVESDGRRNYEDLLLFTSGRIIEAQRFITEDTLFINDINQCQLIGLELRRFAYDFEKASTESRLSGMAAFGERMSIDLKASGVNCDFLTSLLKKYFLPKR